MKIIDIIKKGIEIPTKEFFTVETELFTTLYEMKDKPDFVFAFLGLSSWMGTSLRSGVWTYYESTNKMEIDAIIKYLNSCVIKSEIVGMYVLLIE